MSFGNYGGLGLSTTADGMQTEEDARDKKVLSLLQPVISALSRKRDKTDEEIASLETWRHTQNHHGAPANVLLEVPKAAPKVERTRTPEIPSDSHLAACATVQAMMRDGRWHQDTHAYEECSSAKRLLEIAKPKLFWTIKQKEDRNAPKKCVLSIATMQAMVVRTYQRDLMEAGKEMMEGKTSVLLPQLLHRYCKAIRDLDFIGEKAAEGFNNDPFLLQTSSQMEYEMMKDYRLVPDLMDAAGDLPPALDIDEPQLPGLGRAHRLRAARLQNRYLKFYHALGGGLALVIPMIVMKRIPGDICSLVTTSASVLAFSAVIAWRSDLKPHEILGVTAAYAAVLVVFVGASSIPSTAV